MIDFNVGEVRLFEESTLEFTFGDYYISCNCKDTDDEDMRSIDLLIFYRLERYQGQTCCAECGKSDWREYTQALPV